MPNLDSYTDEELGQMLRAANRSMAYDNHTRFTALDSFCDWLGVVGLGWIAATVKTVAWAWERVRGIWRSIFR
jgi:hypothetical protein